MELSIIVVNFNTKNILKDCLESIYRNTNGLEFEVIVVDNDSHDGSVEMIKGYFSQVKLMVNFENLGFAKANNQGMANARGDFVLLLNSDTLIKNNAIKTLVDYLKGHNEISIVGPKLLNLDGSIAFSCKRFSNFINIIYLYFNKYN